MLTSLTSITRSSGTWPRHKAKARARKATRKSIARAGQRDRDKAASRTL